MQFVCGIGSRIALQFGMIGLSACLTGWTNCFVFCFLLVVATGGLVAVIVNFVFVTIAINLVFVLSSNEDNGSGKVLAPYIDGEKIWFSLER